MISIRNLFIAFFATPLLLIGCKSRSEPNKEVTQPSARSGSRAEQVISIHEAALNGDLNKVSLLLDRGCNPDTLDADGRTALMYAAFNGHTTVLQKLIQRGASLNTCDVYGRTALMMAASGPYQEAVKLLLVNQADPNITDKEDHFSALMYAAAEGQTEVVKLLLTYNADPFMKDIDGDEALTFAGNNNHDEAASIIQASKDKYKKRK
jgi:uncharacterized protein